jgi:uncharacterized protein (DUF169 family)
MPSDAVPVFSQAPLSDLEQALRVGLLLEHGPVGMRVAHGPGIPGQTEPGPPVSPLLYCEAVARAARGEVLGLGLQDIFCDTAPLILGLQDGFDDEDFLESYVAGGLYGDLDTTVAMLSTVSVMRDVSRVIVAPLSWYEDQESPDVVVITTTAYGAMRLVQAAGYRGLIARSAPIGMHGVCAECTAAPYSTGQMCVSLLCSNARYGTHWDDTHLAVGVPTRVLPALVDGLLRTMDRYETDERKAAIRAAHEALAHAWPPLTDAIARSKDGTAYYMNGGTCLPRA